MHFSLPSPSRRLALATGLGCLLCVMYLLSFNGIPKANDELWLADTTQSVALRGNFWLNQTQFTIPKRIVSNVEPVQPILAAPLYWIGYHLPWAGNMHALYLFNPLVTALTGILLFYYALHLGYDERTALIAGLAFGLTTMAWPYTRTFFREPLTGLNLLAAAYLWERWRTAFSGQHPRRWWWFGLATSATCLALLSKEAAIVLLPMLVLIAWPGAAALRASGRDRIALIAGGAVLLAAVGVVTLVLTDTFKGVGRIEEVLQLVDNLRTGLPWIGPGVTGLLISPGRGIWWFSPILLLALASPALLPKDRWRESWLILGTTLLFATVYSEVRKDLWFGGAGWGSRFMAPMIPFLLLAAVPAIDRTLNSARRWPKIALAGLAAISAGVQIVGVYVDIYDYSVYMQRTTGQLPWLGAGIWDVRWSQIVGGLLYLPQSHTDVMWFQKGTDWLALAVISAGAAAIGGLVWRIARAGEAPTRLARLAVLAGPALVLALSAFTLWRSMPDPRYREDTPQIEALRVDLERTAERQDTVMLSNWHYARYFINTYKGRATWWGLPTPPGERPSPEQPADIVSDEVETLVGRRGRPVIEYSLEGGPAYNGHPIWLVGDASPFLTWANRPTEWYLAKYAYFVSAQDYASNARVSRFLPMRAPSADENPAEPSGARFGDSIRLVGHDLEIFPPTSTPTGLHAGDSLGLSLLWESIGAVSTDYTVAVHVISRDQAVVTQQDRAPVAGFAPTSQWKPGERIRDNFGFILPADLPPGEYELWVTIYSWPSLEKLPVTAADGKAVGDHVVISGLTVR